MAKVPGVEWCSQGIALVKSYLRNAGLIGQQSAQQQTLVNARNRSRTPIGAR